MMDKTVVYVKKTTREKLKNFGKMGDTYDIAINNLIKFANKNNYFSDKSMEYRVSKMYLSGNYKSRAELGREIGITGQRVGQLIEARKTRNNLKIPFTTNTEVILASKPLTNNTDRIQLLKLVEQGNINVCDTKKIAKLCQNDEDLRKKILYEGASYQKITEFKVGDIND